MRLISIQVSPHQLRKLKKGHKVRLRKGSGFNVVVNPTTYNLVSRSFKKGKAMDVKLSSEELEANKQVSENPEKMNEIADLTKNESGEAPEMTGNGIFSKAKSFLKKAAPILKPLAREGLKLAEPEISKKIGNRPVLKKALDLGMKEANKALGRGMPRGCGMNGYDSSSDEDEPRVHGQTKKLSKAMAKARENSASMTKSAIEARIRNHYPTYEELSEQPFAPFSRGYGLPGSHHPRSHDLSIVGRGAGMVGYGFTSPALMSQPYSANYNMSHFLPPHFQHYNNSMRLHEDTEGEGLYAGRGFGLFA
jgi:hypothetical protein